LQLGASLERACCCGRLAAHKLHTSRTQTAHKLHTQTIHKLRKAPSANKGLSARVLACKEQRWMEKNNKKLKKKPQTETRSSRREREKRSNGILIFACAPLRPSEFLALGGLWAKLGPDVSGTIELRLLIGSFAATCCCSVSSWSFGEFALLCFWMRRTHPKAHTIGRQRLCAADCVPQTVCRRLCALNCQRQSAGCAAEGSCALPSCREALFLRLIAAQRETVRGSACLAAC